MDFAAGKMSADNLSTEAGDLEGRIEALHSGGGDGDFWDTETLRNIVIEERESIIEEIGEEIALGVRNISDEEYTLLPTLSDDDLLDYYYGRLTQREDLLETIYRTIDAAYERGEVGDEHLISELMNGLFFVPGYWRNRGIVTYYPDVTLPSLDPPKEEYIARLRRTRMTRSSGNYQRTYGNIQYISDEGWRRLAIANGLSPDADHDTIIDGIVASQNKGAKELIAKGRDSVIRSRSMVAMMIQYP